MKREDVVRLRELLAKATPGPLHAEEVDGWWCVAREPSTPNGAGFAVDGECWKQADAELIAEAITALPTLLALAEAVEGLTNDLNLMNEQGETPDGDGITVNVQLWAERWLGRLVAAPEGSEGYARG